MIFTEKFCPGCGKDGCFGHHPETDPDTAAVLARHEQGDHDACHPDAMCSTAQPDQPEPEQGAREVLLWCVECRGVPSSLCEIDEHDVFWAERTAFPVKVSSLRPEDVAHVCSTCFMLPGSDSAIAKGCICPVLDNGHGHNVSRIVTCFDCPVHLI